MPAEVLLATRLVERSTSYLTFTVPVTVENQGVAEFSYAYCLATLDALVSRRWLRGWSPNCLGAPDVRIPAGATRDLAIPVQLPVSGAAAPSWSGALGTRYRVVLRLIPAAGLDGAHPQLVSNSFTVRERE